ncbi:uncharacterized protein Tco_1349989 [Tanacetum coccineum]
MAANEASQDRCPAFTCCEVLAAHTFISYPKHCVRSYNLFEFLREIAGMVPDLADSDAAGEDRSDDRNFGRKKGVAAIVRIQLKADKSPFQRTYAARVVKDCIWLFEQEQALGFSSVLTNTRMTVIKLKSGGLWVHAPIAPTKECIQILDSRNQSYTLGANAAVAADTSYPNNS